SRNAAALLSVFDVSVREQQSAISQIHQQLGEIEACKQRLMQEWLQAHQNERKFGRILDRQTQAEARKRNLKDERRMEDLLTARHSAAAI
ncbi:MAG: hypothetical protein D6751_07270, partial [Deltaproteobacteria bacterium]